MNSFAQTRRMLMRRKANANHATTVTERAMNLAHPGLLKEGMAEVPLFAGRPGLQARLTAGTVVSPVALMVDLSPFSDVVASMSAEEIRQVLEAYYGTVVPIITDHGGVVEKFIGDAVVALFGAPFNGGDDSTKSEADQAFVASQALIDRVHDEFCGELVAKVSLAYGQGFVGYLGVHPHQELTVVGGLLTELFRLESKAEPETIILLEDFFIRFRDKLPIVPPTSAGTAEWLLDPVQTIFLKGLGSHDVRVIRRRR